MAAIYSKDPKTTSETTKYGTPTQSQQTTHPLIKN